MKKWAADVGPLLGGIGREVLGADARVAHAAFGDEPFEIVAYNGYGNANRARLWPRSRETEHPRLVESLRARSRWRRDTAWPVARSSSELPSSMEWLIHSAR